MSRAGYFIAVTITALLNVVNGDFLLSAPQCASWEYWCEDRCGSALYGDTCCPISNGQYNMCGTDTFCCGDGCCPLGTICTSVGGCIPAGTGSESNQTETTVTITTYILETMTAFTTIAGSCSNPGDVSTNSEGTATMPTASQSLEEVVIGSSTYFLGTGLQTITSNGETIVLGPSGGLEIGSDSISLPMTGQGVITTDGITISFSNPNQLSVTSESSSPNSINPITTVFPDGQTGIISGSVIIIGSSTVTIPQVTAPTTLTTDGETFTLLPSDTGSESVSTISEPDGQTVISSGSFIIIGSSMITIPQVTLPTTLTTDGETFTFSPSTLISSSTSFSVTTVQPTTSTEPNGSLTTISGTTETISSNSQSPSLTTIPPSISTEPDGSLTTVSGTTEALSSGSPSVTNTQSLTTSASGSVSTQSGITSTTNNPSSNTQPPTTTPPGSQTSNPSASSSSGSHLIPCVVPPIPICIPCLIGPAFLCFPPGTGPPTGGPLPSGSQSSSSECTTKTITDFFVSCLTINPTSSSCTTTSSMKISGCTVPPATTSTTRGCVSVNFQQDVSTMADGNGDCFPVGCDADSCSASLDSSGTARCQLVYNGCPCTGFSVSSTSVPSTTTSSHSTSTSTSHSTSSSSTTQSSTASVPDVFMTFTAPEVTPTCQQPGLMQYLTSQGVTLPSKAPSLNIELPIADQSGFWEVELGGPSNPTDDIAAWQVSQDGGPALNSGSGGASSFNWTNSQSPTGTDLELEMVPNLGIVIFEVTVTGRVDCIPPTPTSTQVPTTTPSPTSTLAPQPTGGFWIVDQTDSFVGLEENYIVPDSSDACDKIAFPNVAFPYQVTITDSSSKIHDHPGEFVLTANDFTASQEFVNMCNIKGLVITFTQDSSDSSRLNFSDNQSPSNTGFCVNVASQTTATCVPDPTDLPQDTQTSHNLLHCQKAGDSNYCNNWP